MEGDCIVLHDDALCFISIHTLRVEGDEGYMHVAVINYISIHTLRVEGDVKLVNHVHNTINFNPHPPRGG